MLNSRLSVGKLFSQTPGWEILPPSHAPSFSLSFFEFVTSGHSFTCPFSSKLASSYLVLASNLGSQLVARHPFGGQGILSQRLPETIRKHRYLLYNSLTAAKFQLRSINKSNVVFGGTTMWGTMSQHQEGWELLYWWQSLPNRLM